MENDKHRLRIYEHYVSAVGESPAPPDIRGLRSREPYLSRVIDRHFPRDKSAPILDLGCGHGALVHFAHQAGYTNLRGVDRSPEQVAAARRLGIGNIELGEVISFLSECTTSSFSCVVCWDLLEHFARDELFEALDGIRRVLKPGGTFIIHAPNGESPFCTRILYSDLTHQLAFTQASIAKLLYDCGFLEVQSYEDAPIPHGVRSVGRWILWKIIRGILLVYLAVETGSAGRKTVLTQCFLTVARC